MKFTMIVRYKHMLFYFLLLVCASFGDKPVQHSVANQMQVKDFVLDDQFKKTHEQVFPKSRASIFALADRKGSDQLEDWVTPFYKRYTDQVDICGIANLKGVPGLLKPMIRGLFKSGIDYPVMMDWSGEICEALSYKPKVADIFIITKDGMVTFRTSGAASEKKLEACYVIVDALLADEETEERAPAESKDVPQQGSVPQTSESTFGEPTQES